MPELDPRVEPLARMWVLCDPNRGGTDPDETITMHNPEREVPQWHWFIPRAEASLAFLKKNGWAVVEDRD